jgi:hypothetical protein
MDAIKEPSNIGSCGSTITWFTLLLEVGQTLIVLPKKITGYNH